MKITRVLIVSIVTGAIINVLEFVLAFFMARGIGEWTIRMGNIHLGIIVSLSLVLFLVTGFLCLRDMTRTEIAKSATIIVLYYVGALALQSVIFRLGIFSWGLNALLFIPVELYSVVIKVTLRFAGSSWLGIVMSVLFPYLYVLFGHRQEHVANLEAFSGIDDD